MFPKGEELSKMQQVSTDQVNFDVSCSRVEENGFSNYPSFLDSEKTVQEFLQQPPIKAVDDHLLEFSEAMRTVAKALRRVAEGKASAQAEAAEWKRNMN